MQALWPIIIIIIVLFRIFDDMDSAAYNHVHTASSNEPACQFNTSISHFWLVAWRITIPAVASVKNGTRGVWRVLRSTRQPSRFSRESPDLAGSLPIFGYKLPSRPVDEKRAFSPDFR